MKKLKKKIRKREKRHRRRSSSSSTDSESSKSSSRSSENQQRERSRSTSLPKHPDDSKIDHDSNSVNDAEQDKGSSEDLKNDIGKRVYEEKIRSNHIQSEVALRWEDILKKGLPKDDK